jgi:predicted nucleic acid-binding protein|tara:strand:+ start:823 stop:975 length:153 start_codon:yes stop_codon:yes gene_type:complete
LNRSWGLSHNLTEYDAHYVALAEATGAKMATIDRRLAQVSGLTGEFLTPD